MSIVMEGTLLWQPSEDFQRASNMRHYMDWLAQTRGLRFDDYNALWQWSVDHLEDFCFQITHLRHKKIGHI